MGSGSPLPDSDNYCIPLLVTSPRTGISSLGGGGGTLHMKGVGMRVVLLRGVNFGLWSHLGCSGQNAITFSHEGLV